MNDDTPERQLITAIRRDLHTVRETVYAAFQDRFTNE